MLDLVFVFLTVAFFVVCRAFVELCDQLTDSRQHGAQDTAIRG